ncbi:MAG: ComEA family DNA-binding protein [Aquisalimonadaceae bacterium]
MKFSAVRAVLFGLCILFSSSSLVHADSAPVNINTADAQTIATALNGVGMTRATAIVEYRESNGGFESVEDLLNVSGIGPTTVEANRQNIVLE